MKYRNGFISNSSSCSFILYGTEVTDQIKEKCEQYAKSLDLDLRNIHDDKFNMYEFADTIGIDYYDLEDDCEIIGEIIIESDENECLEYKKIDLKTLFITKSITKLSEITGIDRHEFSLITGTRAC